MRHVPKVLQLMGRTVPFPLSKRSRQGGVTLIEVLISLVILLFGLLGLVGVMVQSQRAQLESYQRVQALMLVQDMVARMSSNKAAAACYVTVNPLGTGNGATPDASGCATGTSAEKTKVTSDLTEWKGLLLGSAETNASSENVGGVLGARGCVVADVAVTGKYQISVAWQGTSPAGAPPAGIPCGQNQYGDDAYRRAVSVTLMLI